MIRRALLGAAAALALCGPAGAVQTASAIATGTSASGQTVIDSGSLGTGWAAGDSILVALGSAGATPSGSVIAGCDASVHSGCAVAAVDSGVTAVLTVVTPLPTGAVVAIASFAPAGPRSGLYYHMLSAGEASAINSAATAKARALYSATGSSNARTIIVAKLTGSASTSDKACSGATCANATSSTPSVTTTSFSASNSVACFAMETSSGAGAGFSEASGFTDVGSIAAQDSANWLHLACKIITGSTSAVTYGPGLTSAPWVIVWGNFGAAGGAATRGMFLRGLGR